MAQVDEEQPDAKIQPFRLGQHRLERPPFQTWEQQNRRDRHLLHQFLGQRKTVAFLVAGCSIGIGDEIYPTWGEPVDEVGRWTLDSRNALDTLMGKMTDDPLVGDPRWNQGSVAP